MDRQTLESSIHTLFGGRNFEGAQVVSLLVHQSLGGWINLDHLGAIVSPSLNTLKYGNPVGMRENLLTMLEVSLKPGRRISIHSNQHGCLSEAMP